MPINVKPLANVVTKWKNNAGNAGTAYQSGIQNPKQPQEQAATAAAGTWANGVAAAAQAGSFAKGIARSSGKWQRNALAKGVQRYPQGVNAASSDFQNGIGPVLTTLASLNLPPRAPKGDPSNLQRVAAVATALRAMKLSATH